MKGDGRDSLKMCAMEDFSTVHMSKLLLLDQLKKIQTIVKIPDEQPLKTLQMG